MYAYCDEKGYDDFDADAFFDHCSDDGWCDSNGTKITAWWRFLDVCYERNAYMLPAEARHTKEPKIDENTMRDNFRNHCDSEEELKLVVAVAMQHQEEFEDDRKSGRNNWKYKSTSNRIDDLPHTEHSFYLPAAIYSNYKWSYRDLYESKDELIKSALTSVFGTCEVMPDEKRPKRRRRRGESEESSFDADNFLAVAMQRNFRTGT